MAKRPSRIIEICRLKDSPEWFRVANPTDRDLKQAAYWLSNSFCEYLEYSSNGGGMVGRYIRSEDCHKYIPKERGR